MATGDVLQVGYGWRIEMAGSVVDEISVTSDLCLRFLHGPHGQYAGDGFLITLTSPFRLHLGDGREMTLDPEEHREQLGPALTLFSDSANEVLVTEEGGLRVSFESGATVEADPAPSYEAWQVHGPGGLMVIATLDGGDPAIWKRAHSAEVYEN